MSESNAKLSIDGGEQIFCSENLLAQAIENLLSNSIKFCEEGSPKLIVSAVEKNYTNEILIEDNGPGIP